MADIEIHFFGWAKDPVENADKIWGWVNVEGKLYNFWGRRGTEEKQKKINFKRNSNNWQGNHELRRLTEKKMHPSGDKTPYKSIPCSRNADGVWADIDAVYPGFSKHFGKQLMYARLSDSVIGV